MVQLPVDDPAIPQSVMTMRPTLYKEANDYCCILGPDPQVGIFGCGKSPIEALKDWEVHYHDFLKNSNGSPSVHKYVEARMAGNTASL